MLSKRVSPPVPALTLMTEEDAGPSPASPVIPSEVTAPNDLVSFTCTTSRSEQLVIPIAKKGKALHKNACNPQSQRRASFNKRRTKCLPWNCIVQKFHWTREDRPRCSTDCIRDGRVHIERCRVRYASRHPEIRADERIRGNISIEEGNDHRMQIFSSTKNTIPVCLGIYLPVSPKRQ